MTKILYKLLVKMHKKSFYYFHSKQTPFEPETEYKISNFVDYLFDIIIFGTLETLLTIWDKIVKKLNFTIRDD